MDFKTLRALQSKYDKTKEIAKQIKEAEKDPEFKLSDIFRFYSLGGNVVFRPLQEAYANRDFDKTFYFRILEVPNGFPAGKFLANLGDKERILDPKSGKYKNVSTKDKNRMVKAYKLTGDPDEHYIKFDVLTIDENSCVKCNLMSAIALIMYHTNLFDQTRKTVQVEELSEIEFKALSKSKKSTKTAE